MQRLFTRIWFLIVFASALLGSSASALAAPTVSVSPASPITVYAGDPAVTLTASSTGATGAVTYAWAAKAPTTDTSLLTVSAAPSASATFNTPATVTADTNYTYTVTGTDSTGSDSADITITVKPTLAVSATATPATVDEGGVASTLAATGSGGAGPYTYSWAPKTGAPADAATRISATTGATVTFTSGAVTANTPYTYVVTVTDSANRTASGEVTVTVTDVPTLTVSATATPATVDEGGVTSTLAATGSGGAGPYTYSWAPKAGAPTDAATRISATTGATVTFTSGAVTANTPYTYVVTVTDSGNRTATGEVTVTVNNVTPKAEAGADQTVNEGGLVTLHGSGVSDTGGRITRYIWTSLTDQALVLPDIAEPTFTAPRVGINGKQFRFRLTVTDDKGAIATDEVVITVTNDPAKNLPPVPAITKTFDSVKPGEEFTLDASGTTDPDGGETITTYTWSQKAEDTLQLEILEGNQKVGQFRAPAINGTTQVTLILTVTDEEGASATKEEAILITLDDNLKLPVAAAGKTISVDVGETVTLDGSASHDSNEDGSIERYEWRQTKGTQVALQNAEQAVATFIAPSTINPDPGRKTETFVFELKVIDNDKLFDTDVVFVNVGPNAKPLVDAGEDQIDVEEGSTVTLVGSAEDSDGSISEFEWQLVSGTAPESVVFSDPGSPSVTFVTPPVTGTDALTLTFKLVARDDLGGIGEDTVAVTIKDNGIVNVPTEFVPIRAATDAAEGVGFDVKDGNIYKLSAKKVPLNERATQKNRPRSIPYGLFDFTLRVAKEGGSATVRIWVPEDVSSGYAWYKYNSATETWSVYPNAVFSGNEILLTLTDGGEGDDDGIKNGVIKDPSGLGSVTATETTRVEGSSGGGAMFWLLVPAALAGWRRKRRVA